MGDQLHIVSLYSLAKNLDYCCLVVNHPDDQQYIYRRLIPKSTFMLSE